jgi:hypothetical protein
VETLSRFRPDPEVVAGLADIEDEGEDVPALPPGYVPRAWLDGRLMGEAKFEGPYADVGHSRSLSYLGRSWLPESFTTDSVISTAPPFG